MVAPVKCRVCGCTEEKGCAEEGLGAVRRCYWQPDEGDLCSVCYDAVIMATYWVKSAHRPNWEALRREVECPPKRNAQTVASAGGAQ